MSREDKIRLLKNLQGGSGVSGGNPFASPSPKKKAARPGTALPKRKSGLDDSRLGSSMSSAKFRSPPKTAQKGAGLRTSPSKVSNGGTFQVRASSPIKSGSPIRTEIGSQHGELNLNSLIRPQDTLSPGEVVGYLQELL